MKLLTNSQGQAITPTVLIVAASLASTFYVGEAVVKVVKKVDRTVASETKKVARGIVHVVTLGRK